MNNSIQQIRVHKTEIDYFKRIGFILGRIVDKYMKQERYKAMRRIGDFPKAPMSSDNNVIVGYLRYECYLDIRKNIIYRRY